MSFLLEKMCEDDKVNRYEYEALIKTVFSTIKLRPEQFLHFNQLLENESSPSLKNCLHVAFELLKTFTIGDHALFLMTMNPFIVSMNNDLLSRVNEIFQQAKTLSLETRINFILYAMQQNYLDFFPANLIKEYTTVAYYYNYQLTKTNDRSNISRMLDLINTSNFDPLLLKFIDNSKAQECFAESIVFLVMQGEPLSITAAVKKYLVNHKEALTCQTNARLNYGARLVGPR